MFDLHMILDGSILLVKISKASGTFKLVLLQASGSFLGIHKVFSV